MGVQAAVDRATVARVWQFMRDAHFVDTSSQTLKFQVAVLNSEAHTVAFWSMRISMLPSGRFRAHASIVSAPLLSSGSFWSPRDILSSATHMLVFFLTLAHTASVSGVMCFAHEAISSRQGAPSTETDTGTATGTVSVDMSKTSHWFRSLCQLSFLGLCISLVCGSYLNGATVRQTRLYSMVHMQGFPAAQFLPVNMYHDLLAPARILLPSKGGRESAAGGMCNVVSDGTRDALEIRGAEHQVPLWEQQTDANGALENHSSLLVRPT